MSIDQENISKELAVYVVDAFVKDGQGGNPAGVVLGADLLSEADMQSIAASIGVSETAFVSRSRTEGARLDFFTPNRRIAHCGHATIAAFSLMVSSGLIGNGMTSKETVDGPRPIRVIDSQIYMGQLAPRYRPAADWAKDGVEFSAVLDALGLQVEQLDPRFAPQVVDTGNRFLLIGLVDRSALASVVPDLAAIARISDALDLIGFYPFTTDTTNSAEHASARMFGPRFAIEEESATGMAAGPLACVLYDFLNYRNPRIVIEQGAFMRPARPSRIEVELQLEEGRIAALMAGGRAKVRVTRQVSLPVLGIPASSADPVVSGKQARTAAAPAPA